MQLREVMDETFVLLPATFTVSRALRFLAGVDFTHLIILRTEPLATFHYLYRRQEALARLQSAGANLDLRDAFMLHEWSATATQESSAGAESAPDRVVVTEQGQVVGFFDAGSAEAARPSAGRRSFAAGPRRFASYPAIVAPERVAPAATFSILVGFRDDPDAALAGAARIDVLSESGDSCLVVLVADGLDLDRTWAALPLERNAHFQVQCTSRSSAGTASIEAQYFFRNQLISSARRSLVIGEGASPAAPSAAGSPCRVALPGSGAHVDLTISVTCTTAGTLAWLYSAEALDLVTKAPVITSLQDARAFAADLMKDLRNVSYRGPLAANILASRGQDIAALMPGDLFKVLRDLHAKLGRTPTLLLVTNEVYIPWELAVLDEPLDPGAQPFLAAQTAMGRWLRDDQVMMPPEISLEIRRITVVAGAYGLETGLPVLQHALAERAELERDWDAVAVDATQADLIPVVNGAKIPGHLIHFAVHGLSDPMLNDQDILLADRTHLPAAALTGGYRRGEMPRFSFVFLNACQVGTAGASLGQAAGFPGLLVRRGAMGFVAPLWDVDDDLACTLAKRFYDATLAQKMEVGAILREFRCQFDGRSSTTPMAYIYYGHPALTLQRQPHPGAR